MLLKLGSYEGVSAIILKVMLIAVFIAGFFFSYGAFMERRRVRTQIDRLTQDLIAKIRLFSSDAQWKKFHMAAKTITPPPVNKAADTAVKERNTALIKKAALWFGVAAGLVLFLILAMWNLDGRQFNMKRLIGKSFSLLSIVALTEIVFYTLVTADYRYLDQHYIERVIIQKLSDYARS